MPGAQLEEPAVEEERSEPVQVGCGAFLGTDDLRTNESDYLIGATVDFVLAFVYV